MKPIPTPSLYILLSVALEERHGYDIMKTVRDVSDGAIKLGPSTLYTSIQRLIDSGLIENAREEVAANGTVRRYYAITSAGRSCLNAEMTRMKRMLRAAASLKLMSV